MASPAGVGTVSRSAVRDVPAEVDTLGFSPYVEALAAFLDSPGTQPPLTLSIEGEWGSGKSSFMGQLASALSRAGSSPSIVVRFNAWRFDKSDAMWAAFAQAVARELRKQVDWPMRLRGTVRLFLLRVNGPSGWLRLAYFVAAWLLLVAACLIGFFYLGTHSALEMRAMHSLFRPKEATQDVPESYRFLLSSGAWTGALGVLIAALAKSGKWLKSWLFDLDLKEVLSSPDYDKHVEFVEEFHRDFGKTVRAFAGNRKLYVFVDDLDRCDLPKAAELMQAINLMIGEDDHIVFILGLDRDKVAAAIAAKYKDLIPFLQKPEGGQKDASVAQRLAFGHEYMEKFIQLSFRIPRPSGDEVMRHFVAKLASAAKEGGAARGKDTMLQAEQGRIYRRLTAGEDSEEIVDVVLMVRHLLGNNPRRLKQFLNAYRLALYLASGQGLFDEGSTGGSPLTFQQLGKLVALFLRFPQLPEQLGDEPKLLAEAEDAASAPRSEDLDGGGTERWAELLQVREAAELLRFGMERADYRSFSLQELDLRPILQIVPLVPYPAEQPAVASAAPPMERMNVGGAEAPASSASPELGGAGTPPDPLLQQAIRRDRANRAGSAPTTGSAGPKTSGAARRPSFPSANE